MNVSQVFLLMKMGKQFLFPRTKNFRNYCQKNKIQLRFRCKFQVICYTERVKKNKAVHCFLLRTILPEYIIFTMGLMFRLHVKLKIVTIKRQ